MVKPSRALLPLCACFRGDVPPRADWKTLIALANHTLTTPSLMPFVNAQRAEIPMEVATYIEELYARNKKRNERLIVQLEETVLALNGAGITPVLIKGTASLAISAPADRAMRLMSDLDIVVRPDKIDAAMEALAGIGYSIDYEADRRQTKWHADLRRPQDAGMIDLHRAFPAEAYLDWTADDLNAQLRLVRLGAASALVPCPELQASVLVVHDQFQDHGYWTGSIDLRHLLDLKALTVAPGGIRWDFLIAMASSPLVRNALDTQILLLTHLLDVAWPTAHKKRLVPRLQVWRLLLQARHPSLRYLLLPMGLIDLRNHRARPGAAISRAEPSGLPRHERKRWFPRFATLVFLLSLLRRYRIGKL